jgi:Lrp/AsnC family transcriptional regulator for asnA, asnC and gidA
MSGSLDQLDLAIVELLEERGRTSNRQIARSLGVSEGTIRARIKRLQAAGLLRIIAVRNLNYGPFALAHLGILVEAGELRSVAAAVAGVPETVFAAIAVGHYDLVAMVMGNDRGHLAEILNDRIACIPGINRIEATETLRSMKFLPNLRKMR